MRKNFLLLFLMTLLPLAGWAEDVNLAAQGTVVSATLGSTELTYVGKNTTPAIQKITVTVGNSDPVEIIGAAVDEKFTITYFKSAVNQGTAGVKNAGDYSFKISAKQGSGYTGENVSVVGSEFTILKGNLVIHAENATKTYGADDPTELQYSVVDGLVGDDDVNNVVVNFTALTRSGNNAGENVSTYHYSTITATSVNYLVEVENNTDVTLEITKANLTATYDQGNAIAKFYGEANPALNPTKMEYTGWVGAEADGNNDDAEKAALLANASLDYTMNDTKANATPEGVYLNGQSGYTLHFTGFDLANYNVTLPANQKMMVKQIALAAAPNAVPNPAKNYFAYGKENAEKTYSGVAQTPDYTVTYIDRQGTTHNLEAGANKDFTISYAYCATSNGQYTNYGAQNVDNITAGYYKAKISAVANGNYAGDLEVDGFDYQIAKKDLYVTVVDKEKVYDAAEFPITNQVGQPGDQGYQEGATFEYNGLVAADNTPVKIAAITGVTAAYDDNLGDGKHANVKAYKVKAVIAGNSPLNTNYKPEGLATGTYTITKRQINVTAYPQTITFGDDAPVWEATEVVMNNDEYVSGFVTLQAKDGNVGLADAADKAAILDAITVSLKAGIDGTTTGTWADGIEVKTKQNAATLCPNYTINGVAGQYKIEGASLTLIAKNVSLEYGTVYSLTDANTFKFNTTGANPVGTVEYEIWNETGTQKLNELPSAVGQYTIKIVEKNSYKPANYDDITYVPGTLTITTRTLTITMDALSLHKGATQAILDTYKNKVHVANEADNGDVFKFNLQFNTVGQGAVALNQQGALDSDASEEAYAIGLKVVPDGDLSANYVIAGADANNAVFFPLKVLAANKLDLVAGDDELFHKIQDAHNKQVNVTINFNARNRKINNNANTPVHNWAADNWNVLVLPFDITVAELSSRLGYAAGADQYNYAIVNTVKEDSETGKFQFQLCMGTIKANTPFMVKTQSDITTTDAEQLATITGVINFGTKTIKAPESATVSAKLGNGFKLVGTYANTVLDKTSPWNEAANESFYKFMYGDDDSQYRYFGKNSNNSWKIVPFDGFVDLSGDPLNAAKAIFEFEEPDGSVTAIKSISAETTSKNAKAEGWYTLNGVKLQSAPTQKGIYINNGKKVVVK